MRKIAVACEENQVSEHFGLCKHFKVYNIEGKSVRLIEQLANPGHKPCELPEYICNFGATTIISGSMGKAAAHIAKEHGIEKIVGATGDTDEVIASYIDGSLISTGQLCDSWICEFLH